MQWCQRANYSFVLMLCKTKTKKKFEQAITREKGSVGQAIQIMIAFVSNIILLHEKSFLFLFMRPNQHWKSKKSAIEKVLHVPYTRLIKSEKTFLQSHAHTHTHAIGSNIPIQTAIFISHFYLTRPKNKYEKKRTKNLYCSVDFSRFNFEKLQHEVEEESQKRKMKENNFVDVF